MNGTFHSRQVTAATPLHVPSRDDDGVHPRTSIGTLTRVRWALRGGLSLASAIAAVACTQPDGEGGGPAASRPDVVRCELPAGATIEGHAASTRKQLQVGDAEAQQALQGLTIEAGIPLYESRPGAPVAIYLDFDGGRYDGQSYEGARGAQPVDIVLAALQVAETYRDFNINVTTDAAVLDRAATKRWAWILIEDSWGSSGEARVPGVGRTSNANGIAGSDAVFLSDSHPQAGYLLTHEVGHMFGLNHSGRNDGTFLEWSELRESRLGGWLGGRDSHFTRGYEWKCSQTAYYGPWWQIPHRIIEGVANVAAGVGPDQDSPLPAGCTTSEVYVDAEVMEGQPIEVRFTDLPGESDWIGLFPWGTDNNDDYLDWKYTGERVNGSLQLEGPAEGCYEARAFLGDGDQLIARVGFAVGSPGGCVTDGADAGDSGGDDTPTTGGDSSGTTGEGSSTTGEGGSTTGDGSSTTGEGIPTTGDGSSSSTGEDVPSNGDDPMPATGGESSGATGGDASTSGDDAGGATGVHDPGAIEDTTGGDASTPFRSADGGAPNAGPAAPITGGCSAVAVGQENPWWCLVLLVGLLGRRRATG